MSKPTYVQEYQAIVEVPRVAGVGFLPCVGAPGQSDQ